MTAAEDAARISVAMQKGGVGKTTLTVHTGGALAQRGHDVLLVDLDPQGGLTAATGFRKDVYAPSSPSMHDVLVDDTPELITDIILEEHDEFDVVPANENMVNTVSALNADSSMVGKYHRIENALDVVEDRYDYILVDCPPSIDILTNSALIGTQNVLIPMYPEDLSLPAVQNLLSQIRTVEDEFGISIHPPVAAIVNRYQHNNEASDITEYLRGEFADHVPVFQVNDRIALQRANSESDGSIFTHHEDSDMEAVFEDVAEHLDAVFDRDAAAQRAVQNGGESA